jgi:N-acyl homoserine lactone hydrolase
MALPRGWDVKLTILYLGQCDVDKGRLLAPGVDDGVHVLIPIPAFLVETDDGNRVLIDTGMHPKHAEDPDYTFRTVAGLPEILRPVMSRADTLEARLGELGLGLDDVTHVVNTHLHFDHCGHNFLFADRGTPVIVQRRHYEAALTDPAFPNEYYEIDGIDYRFVDGEQELFPGVRGILTPGHAPYHMSIMLDLPRTGKMLLCIDAIYIQANLDHDAWDGMADPAGAKESAAKLVRIAREENATMVYGHDPEQWHTLRKAPDFYE